MTTTPLEIGAEQFARDWLLVVENDFDAYNSLREEANALDVFELSEKLKEDWEQLVEQVVETVEENISPIASLIVSQMLNGWGSYPFHLIAKHVKEGE